MYIWHYMYNKKQWATILSGSIILLPYYYIDNIHHEIHNEDIRAISRHQLMWDAWSICVKHSDNEEYRRPMPQLSWVVYGRWNGRLRGKLDAMNSYH